MRDPIERQAAIDAFTDEIQVTGRANAESVKAYVKLVIDRIKRLPSAQPETANIIVGKSRSGMTMWYQCDNCNEPVDENDLYCRGCGRRFEHGSDR